MEQMIEFPLPVTGNAGIQITCDLIFDLRRGIFQDLILFTKVDRTEGQDRSRRAQRNQKDPEELRLCSQAYGHDRRKTDKYTDADPDPGKKRPDPLVCQYPHFTPRSDASHL